MNILPLKKLINGLLFASLLVSFLGCKGQNSIKVKELCIAIEVENDNYVHSESSLFEIGSHIFSLRQKAIYDSDGMLEKLLVFKSDGILEYSRNDIQDDVRVIENAGLPNSQNWSYKDNSIIKDDGSQLRVESLDEKTFKSKENGKTIIYKLN
jgi:hypothetical protein